MWLVNVGYLKVIVVMVTDRNHSHKLKIIIAMSSERRRLLSPRRYPAAGTRSSIQDGFSYEEGSDSDDDVFDHADKRLLYASANPSVISVASFSEVQSHYLYKYNTVVWYAALCSSTAISQLV